MTFSPMSFLQIKAELAMQGRGGQKAITSVKELLSNE